MKNKRRFNIKKILQDVENRTALQIKTDAFQLATI